MLELVDRNDSKSFDFGRASSILASPTNAKISQKKNQIKKYRSKSKYLNRNRLLICFKTFIVLDTLVSLWITHNRLLLSVIQTDLSGSVRERR